MLFLKQKKMYFYLMKSYKKRKQYSKVFEMLTSINYFIFLMKVVRKVLQYITINYDLLVLKRNKFGRYFQ